MELGNELLEAVVCSVWETGLGFAAQPAPEAGPTEADATAWRGVVHITGAWQGVIVCAGSTGLAHRTAAAMFATTEELLEPEQLRDAFAELTNMIGGNLKALVPGPSQLGLPEVFPAGTEAPAMPDWHAEAAAPFRCAGEPFAVQVFSTASAAVQ